MQHEQTKTTKLSCPACGFQIYNRRYPRCERCKADLPAPLVYSEQERRALREMEAARLDSEMKSHELHRSRNASSSRHASSTGAEVLSGVPGDDGEASGTTFAVDSFVSGGGGVFEAGGASGSFGGDGGSSSSSD